MNCNIKFISLLILFPIFASAAFDDGFAGARAYGMAGAMTAIGDQADHQLINPVAISKISGQQINLTMAKLHAGLSDESSITQNLFAYATADDRTGGIGFLWKRLAVSDLYAENIVSISMSRVTKFGTEKKRQIAIAASAKLLHWHAAPTIAENGQIIEDLPDRVQYSFDFGLIFRPSPNIPIAFSVQNLNRPNIASENSNAIEKMPIITALGIGVIGDRFSWDFDLLFRENEVNVRVGAEHSFDQDRYFLRGGFRLENLAWGTNLTLGVGYRPSKKVQIDYGFMFPIGGILETIGSHRFSVSYNF